MQLDQQRVDVRRGLAESESLLRQTRENYEEKVESLRTSHQEEVKHILAQQALDHSTSRMAELQSKVDTQVVSDPHCLLAYKTQIFVCLYNVQQLVNV